MAPPIRTQLSTMVPMCHPVLLVHLSMAIQAGQHADSWLSADLNSCGSAPGGGLVGSRGCLAGSRGCSLFLRGISALVSIVILRCSSSLQLTCRVYRVPYPRTSDKSLPLGPVLQSLRAERQLGLVGSLVPLLCSSSSRPSALLLSAPWLPVALTQ